MFSFSLALGLGNVKVAACGAQNPGFRVAVTNAGFDYFRQVPCDDPKERMRKRKRKKRKRKKKGAEEKGKRKRRGGGDRARRNRRRTEAWLQT